MPFTAAHPAAVLPLVRRGRWVTAALVAGSIAPDLPSFLPLGLQHQQTHVWTSTIWPDGALALGALVAWWALLRPGLAPLWPAAEARAPVAGWRPALRSAGPLAVSVWCSWVAASLLVGLVTHLAWDSFTHFDGYAVLHWHQLADQVWGHAAYDWLQAISSIGGMAVVAAYLAVRWRRTPPAPAALAAAARPLTRTARVAVVAGIVLVTLVTAAVAFHIARQSFSGRYALLAHTLKPSGGAFIVAIAGWSVIHLLWGGPGSRQRTNPHSREAADVP